MWAAALALLLALRLLGPAGFMPAFDRGAVTIVFCPDAELSAVPAHHHHGDHSKKHHQPCPYAAASAPGALSNYSAPLAALLILGIALLMARPFAFLETHRSHERPPLRGPPVPA